VNCPVCNELVDISVVNEHIDNNCESPTKPGTGNTKPLTKKPPVKKITIMAKVIKKNIEKRMF